MKRSLGFVALLLLLALAGSAFADVTYNNYEGYNPYWHPLGYPNTATYGELFTAPSSPNTNLADFGFWIANPVANGNIVMSAYIATWTGTNAGTLLYSSSPVNYGNTGEAFLSFNTGGLSLAPGGSYVMFLSISQSYGQSFGEAQIDAGSALPGQLNGFAYYNNGGDFNALFTNPWDASGLSPDWAVNLDFTSGSSGVPEPASLILLGTGLLAGVRTIRRKR